ncbi:MAG: UDP-N-acetylmuramoyl-tripeptide--D-alanyl-D-alanine ligase [Sphingomonadales bacterium]|nr:UDP-N-acetylmuramoyl-tripeptide--D-alanyl-D-alanine ligase [Sphingomonadales bacterium]
MKVNWTSDELAAATGGTASGRFVCSGVAFDSREIGAGDLFFALKGESSDGYHYLEQVYANGAAGAVVDRATDGPHILVADTAKALNDLAKAARARVNAKIIGVTGSAGKTGTKEALFAALDRGSRGFAHRSVKSYNNHVGVPLSLSRMPADTQYGIFEMGMNHAGELRELTALVRPDVAIVTTIAPAHIEFFKDESEIAKAKAEIFEGLTAQGTAIIPADNEHYPLLRDAAQRYTQNVVSFGFSEKADVRVTDHVAVAGGTMITAQLPTGSLCYTLSQPGRHWIANSLAVLAAVEAVSGDLAAAGLAMAELGGLAGRGAQHRIAMDGGTILLIDESYNANPASMAATLAQLGTLQGGRRIAVLADMRELGGQSAHYHNGLAGHLALAKVDYAILVGEEMQNLAQTLKQGVEGPDKFDHCSNSKEALELLQVNLQADDIVLVKGSNSMGLSAIIKAYAGGGD